jgi:2-polyprenyl-3-methyl-5-hydroxy-6-metoxy-1,4-benzoquinol methylase
VNRPNVEFIQGDFSSVTDLEGYGSFDVAVSMRVLEHLEDAVVGLKALAGAVHPGGIVLFDFWNRWSYPYLRRVLFRRKSEVLTRFYSPPEMAAMIRDAGLEVRARDGWGYPYLPGKVLEKLAHTRWRVYAYAQLFACTPAGADRADGGDR